MNTYLFCLSNPPVYSDPVGMSAQKNDKCLTYRQKVHRYQEAVKDYDDTRRDLLRKQRDGATTKDELSRARQAAAQAHRVATYWYRELAVWHCTKKQEERKHIKWIVRETKPVVNNKTPKDVQGEGPGYDLVEDTMPKFLELWDAGGKNPLAGSNEAHKKTLEHTPAKARAIEKMYTSKQAHNFWIRPQCFVCKCKEGADPSGWKRKWRAYWSFWHGDEWLNMEDLHLPGDPWTPALERAAMKKAKEFCVDKAEAKGIWP
jgi:hypothetical protein